MALRVRIRVWTVPTPTSANSTPQWIGYTRRTAGGRRSKIWRNYPLSLATERGLWDAAGGSIAPCRSEGTKTDQRSGAAPFMAVKRQTTNDFYDLLLVASTCISAGSIRS